MALEAANDLNINIYTDSNYVCMNSAMSMRPKPKSEASWSAYSSPSTCRNEWPYIHVSHHNGPSEGS